MYVYVDIKLVPGLQLVKWSRVKARKGLGQPQPKPSPLFTLLLCFHSVLLPEHLQRASGN